MIAPTIDAKALDELEAMRNALPEGVWSVPDDATDGLDEAAHCCAGSDGSSLVAFSVTTDRALALARFAAALEQSFRPLVALARRGLELASAPPLDTAAILAKYDEAHREALPPEDEEGIDHEAVDAAAHAAGLKAVAEEAHARGLFRVLGRIHELHGELAAAKAEGKRVTAEREDAIAAALDGARIANGLQQERDAAIARAALLEADAGALARAAKAAMGRIDAIDDSGLELRTRARAVEARHVLERALKERVTPETAASAPARWRHALERIRATLSWWEHGDDCPKRSCAHDDCDCPDDAHNDSIECDCDIDAVNAIVHEAIAGEGRQDLVTLAESQEKLRQTEKSLRAAGEREASAWSRFESVRHELGRWQTAMVDVGRALETAGAPPREWNAAGVIEAAKALKAQRDEAGLQLQLEQEQGEQARKERNAALQREGKALRERDEAREMFWQLVGVAEQREHDAIFRTADHMRAPLGMVRAERDAAIARAEAAEAARAPVGWEGAIAALQGERDAARRALANESAEVEALKGKLRRARLAAHWWKKAATKYRRLDGLAVGSLAFEHGRADQLARAVTALGLRACDAHAAVYRAMRAGPAEAHAACQDGGYLHEAVHACLPAQALPEGVPALATRLDDEVRRHIDALGERALRAERERDAMADRAHGAEASLKSWREWYADAESRLAAALAETQSALYRADIHEGGMDAALDAERERANAAEAERDQYRDATTWEVTCLSCAGLLTKLRAQEERAKRLEPVFVAAQALCEEYGQPGDDEAIDALKDAMRRVPEPGAGPCAHPYRGKSLIDETWHCGRCGATVEAPKGAKEGGGS